MTRDAPLPMRMRGFTLVELLVVIAIIGILAGIVVPNVTRYIGKARVARAVTEIRNADLALTGMLSDAGVSRFRDFLNADGKGIVDGFAHYWDGPQQVGPNVIQFYMTLLEAERFYSTMFYVLLRRGREAGEELSYLDAEVLRKLGSSYMPIGKDPWGHNYKFSMGPHRGDAVFLRSYRGEGYLWDEATLIRAQNDLPGQPPRDFIFKTSGGREQFLDLPGYPAPRNFPVYIYSSGPNETVDALLAAQMIYQDLTDPEFLGGGDDPNNWDSEAGWGDAPE